MRGRERSDPEVVGDPVLWVPSLTFCAQSAHFFSGWAVVLTASFRLGPWWALVGFLVYALLKEGVIDPELEGDDVWPDGVIDFLFYLLGSLVGLAFALWR